MAAPVKEAPMPVILVEVYDALLDAGASEAKARTAAAVILCEHRLVAIGRRQNLVTAMLGVTLGLTLTIYWQVW
jgi:hypothetical protein